MSATDPQRDAQIAAYLEGRMSADERAAFEVLVDGDEALQDAVLAAQEASDPLAALPPPVPPEDFDQRVARRIRRRSRGRYFAERQASALRYPLIFFVLLSLLVLAAVALLGEAFPLRALEDVAPIETPSPPNSPEAPDAPPESGRTEQAPAPHELAHGTTELADVPVRTGAVHGGSTVGATVLVWRYVASVEQPLAEVLPEVQARFGASRVTSHPDRIEIRVPTTQLGGFVERLAQLGPVSRERVPLAVPGESVLVVTQPGTTLPSPE